MGALNEPSLEQCKSCCPIFSRQNFKFELQLHEKLDFFGAKMKLAVTVEAF